MSWGEHLGPDASASLSPLPILRQSNSAPQQARMGDSRDTLAQELAGSAQVGNGVRSLGLGREG